MTDQIAARIRVNAKLFQMACRLEQTKANPELHRELADAFLDRIIDTLL